MDDRAHLQQLLDERTRERDQAEATIRQLTGRPAVRHTYQNGCCLGCGRAEAECRQRHQVGAAPDPYGDLRAAVAGLLNRPAEDPLTVQLARAARGLAEAAPAILEAGNGSVLLEFYYHRYHRASGTTRGAEDKRP